MTPRALTSTIRGYGKYTVKNNTLLTGGMSPPMVQNSMSNGGIIVRHREYIGDITATAAFTNRNFPINPGINESFPWLSQIANAFEQYRFRGLVFEYKSTSADALVTGNTSIGQGTVIMATQYNSISPGFVNKMEMQNYTYANSCKPSNSMLHPVECANFQTPMKVFYVRSGALPDNADEKTYDLGNFNIATEGLSVPDPSDQQSIGELWATFEIEFFKPKFDPNSAEPLSMDHFKNGPDGLSTAFDTALSDELPFGNLSAGYFVGNIGTRLVYSNPTGALQIEFPPGSVSTGECYEICYTALCTTPIAGSNVALLATGATYGFEFLSIINQTPSSPESTGANTYDAITTAASQSSRINFHAYFTATEADLDVIRRISIIFTGKYGGLPGVRGQCDLYVTKIPTRDITKPLSGPQNLTLFGLG